MEKTFDPVVFLHKNNPPLWLRRAATGAGIVYGQL